MIKFLCPHCQKRLGAPEKFAGRKVKCLRCSKAVTIPKESQPLPEKKPRIRFTCPICEQKIGVPKAYAGRRVKCNQCSEILEVPAPSKAASGVRQAVTTSAPQVPKQPEVPMSGGMEEEPPVPELSLQLPDTFSGSSTGTNIFGSDIFTQDLESLQTEATEDLSVGKPTARKVSGPPAKKPTRRKPEEISQTELKAASQKVGRSFDFGGPIRIPLALGASLVLTLVGAAAWAGILTAIGIDYFWLGLPFIMVVATLGGVGSAIFCSGEQNLGLGLAAIGIALFGIFVAKACLAKWLVGPAMKAEIAMLDENLMFGAMCLHLSDQGHWDQDFAWEVIALQQERNGDSMFSFMEEEAPASREAAKPPVEVPEEVDEAWRETTREVNRANEKMQREIMKAQASRLSGGMEGFVFAEAGGTVGGIIGSFGLLDLLWIPFGLYGAWKVGAGRD